MGILKNSLNKIRTLWSKDENSNIQKWLNTIEAPIEDIYQAYYEERKSYYFEIMQDWRTGEWERDLLLPTDETLTLDERKAILYKFLKGTQPVIYYIKDFVALFVSKTYNDVKIIQSKTFFPYNRTKRFFYYVWIVADPLTITANINDMKNTLEDIHAEHCILADVLIFLDFWEWDNPALPLDNASFVTNFYYITLNGSLYEDITDNTNPDGNQVQIDWFINSADPTLKLFARPQETPDLTVRIAEGSITLDGVILEYAGGTSPTFTPPLVGTETFLLYAVYNAGTIDFQIDDTTFFTPSDPQSYYVGLGINIYPIAEVTITAGQTEILDSDIVDVRP